METGHEEGLEWPISTPDFLDWRAQNHVLENLSAWISDEFNLTGGTIPERMEGARVTADFFRMLRVQPAAGRDFFNGEDQLGAAHVAIVSYGLWRERFKSELNQTIKLDGETYTIVGVVPEDFHFPLMGRSSSRTNGPPIVAPAGSISSAGASRNSRKQPAPRP